MLITRISTSIFRSGKMATPTIAISWRMAEMRQSVRIVEQAIDALPEGPIMAKVPKVMKPQRARFITRSKRPKVSWDTSSSATDLRSRIACAFVRPRS